MFQCLVPWLLVENNFSFSSNVRALYSTICTGLAQDVRQEDVSASLAVGAANLPRFNQNCSLDVESMNPLRSSAFHLLPPI